MFEFLTTATDKFVLKSTTQEDMYSASEEAIQMHNAAHAQEDETEEMIIRRWDQVFAQNASESMLKLTQISLCKFTLKVHQTPNFFIKFTPKQF